MTRRILADRDAQVRERMDDPACDPDMLERTYARFHLVNAVVARERRRYRRWIRPRLRRGSPTRLLDIGVGGADSLRRLRDWARRDGAELQALGIDPDGRAIRYARTHMAHRLEGIELLEASSGELVEAERTFDIVVSNHVLHHLDDGDVRALLTDSARLTSPGGIAIHSDLERSALAYTAFAVATWPLQLGPLRGTFIREDGLTSIRRSRRAEELAELSPPGWRVHRGTPWRLDVVRAAP